MIRVSVRLRITLVLVVIVGIVALGQVSSGDGAAPAATSEKAKSCRQIDACRRAVAWNQKRVARLEHALAWQKDQRRKLAHRLLQVTKPVEHLREWTCIHEREGAWNANTGNGYHGGLQMDSSFMRTYGADMIRKYGGGAELWTPRDQMIVAERAHDAGRGFHPWPNTARACGYI